MYFEENGRLRILAEFLKRAGTVHTDDKHLQNRLSISISIIEKIHSLPKKWSTHCEFNIEHVGDQFIDWLNNFDPKGDGQIDHIFSLTYRFLCEYDFSQGPNSGLLSIIEKVQKNMDNMDSDLRSRIIYASYIMPANITKHLLNHKDVGSFKDFENQKNEAIRLKAKWKNEIESTETTVNILKDKLEEYKTAFNFVGLYQGFSDLADKKKNEAFWLFWALFGMAFLILAPLIIEIVFTTSEVIKGELINTSHLMVLLPLISIQVILIYFFRIILFNHRSVKTQILQIELRKTLCQFIQSYTDYSTELKKENANVLEKFESIIFSSLFSGQDKVPSSFDGLTQIGGLIQSLKKS